MKIPILTITKEGLAVSAVYQDSARQFLSVQNIKGQELYVNVHPNPSSEWVDVELSCKKPLNVFIL